MTVVAVVGLRREAILLARHATAVLPRDIADVVDATCVISIGIAGALAPDLAVGDVVIAERVVTANEAFETDGKWTGRLSGALLHARIGAILGRSTIADSAEVKAALHAATRADAVDMESHLAARAARERGLPFAALRVISDRADHSLPPAALVAMKPDGSIALGRVVKSVAMNPAQVPALIRTAREAEKAFAALLRCVEVLGPGLGCPYLG
jgi:hopanoid-associated phosphorylase